MTRMSETKPYSFEHGAFDITVFSDGFIMLPDQIILPDTPVEDRPAILGRIGGDATAAPFQVNIPLIRVGKDLILVDNGSGTRFQDTAGRLAGNLKAAGIDPEAITKVIFTHVHPDHTGATVNSDGTLLYPNADYYVSEAEWAFWTDKDFEIHMPEALHGFARGAQHDLNAVRDRLTLVKPGDEIVSGMQAVSTRGHTPGHISLELRGRDNLLITGDAATSNVVFFEHPDWHFGFDTEPEIALANRKMVLDRAAGEKLKLLGCHWAYPGVGYAERQGTAYRFSAAD